MEGRDRGRASTEFGGSSVCVNAATKVTLQLNLLSLCWLSPDEHLTIHTVRRTNVSFFIHSSPSPLLPFSFLVPVRLLVSLSAQFHHFLFSIAAPEQSVVVSIRFSCANLEESLTPSPIAADFSSSLSIWSRSLGRARASTCCENILRFLLFAFARFALIRRRSLSALLQTKSRLRVRIAEDGREGGSGARGKRRGVGMSRN